jgi:hypothetical protein
MKLVLFGTGTTVGRKLIEAHSPGHSVTDEDTFQIFTDYFYNTLPLKLH